MDASRIRFPSESLLSSDDLSLWQEALNRYSEALESVSSRKGKDLVALDEWYRHEAKEVITNRHPWSLNSLELKKIMLWKITRGKFRPLMKLIESNTDEQVRETSSLSFTALRNGEYEASMQILTSLRGVGIATASAILSLLEPNEFPFMSDEALLSVLPSSKKDYSLKSYSLMKAALKSKAEALGGSFTSEDIGRALWVHVVLFTDTKTKSAHLKDTSNASHATLPLIKRRRR